MSETNGVVDRRGFFGAMIGALATPLVAPFVKVKKSLAGKLSMESMPLLQKHLAQDTFAFSEFKGFAGNKIALNPTFFTKEMIEDDFTTNLMEDQFLAHIVQTSDII